MRSSYRCFWPKRVGLQVAVSRLPRTTARVASLLGVGSAYSRDATDALRVAARHRLRTRPRVSRMRQLLNSYARLLGFSVVLLFSSRCTLPYEWLHLRLIRCICDIEASAMTGNADYKRHSSISHSTRLKPLPGINMLVQQLYLPKSDARCDRLPLSIRRKTKLTIIIYGAKCRPTAAVVRAIRTRSRSHTRISIAPSSTPQDGHRMPSLFGYQQKLSAD
ncbi:hypothetical protein PENSPDRAFT_109735 [Peniophora sp. CONT]|nr:hypothetical protein PENSPDRAFT_109735 [Peniophora sp. CONT]